MQLGPLLVALIFTPLVFGVFGYVYWRQRKMMRRAWRVPDDDPARAKMSIVIVIGIAVIVAYVLLYFFAGESWRRFYILVVELYCASVLWTGLWWWRYGSRRRALIEAVAPSAIRDASSGCVRLEGRAVSLETIAPVAGVTGTPALWYRYHLRGLPPQERDALARRQGLDVQWEAPLPSDVTEVPLGLHDGTGLAAIFPKGAQIFCARREKANEFWNTYIEERIEAGDALFVYGEIASDDELSYHDPTGACITWSRQSASSHTQELPTRVISSPRDGTPFIVSTIGVSELLLAMTRWQQVGIAAALAAFVLAVLVPMYYQ
jgi:hypothetical protein